ncbi:hypothetical protein HKX48_001803 [Thoreauomyces humboldtii]|nr:hypothetical protein HKX48_001803 [Thoreauomyces humboldtii]
MFEAQVAQLKANLPKDPAKEKEKSKFDKGINQLKSNTAISNIVSCFQVIVYESNFDATLDTNIYHLGCNNGYIDIRTGKVQPYTKETRISKSVGYDYFTDGVEYSQDLAKEWNTFVEQIFPIAEERQIAQEYFGYCLLGNHPEKIFAVFKDVSGGYCGKSNFVQAILKAMGSYGTTGNQTHNYANTGFSSQNGHDSHLFAYEKMRLAIFEELDNSRTLDGNQAKNQHGSNMTCHSPPDLYKSGGL